MLDDEESCQNVWPGGIGSLEAWLQIKQPMIQLVIDAGFERSLAEISCVISPCCGIAMAAALREGRGQAYAAMFHARLLLHLRVPAALHCNLVTPAPPVYMNLTGKYSLSMIDPLWLTVSTASPGTAFRVQSACNFLIPTRETFADPRGFRQYVFYEYGVEHELQESDIVCLRSGPPDGGGLHTAIRSVAREGSYGVPASAIFTLTSVDEPGHWQLPGRRRPSLRRLFTVTVSYA